MALDEPKKEEKTVRVDNFDILIEEQVKQYATDQVLDYVSSRYGEGFVLKRAGADCC